MLSKLQIRTVALFLLLLTIILRYSLIADGLKLIYYLILSLFQNPELTFSLIDYETIDLIFSVVLILLLPILLLKFKERIVFLNRSISVISFGIIIISMGFIFAPIIADMHPNAQNDLRVTRFLSPLAKAQKIFLKHDLKDGEHEPVIQIKSRIVKSAVNEGVQFIDSLASGGDSIKIFQANNSRSLHKSEIIFDGDKPFVKSKIFLFGTDELGRDIFSRVIYGSRISIFIGLISVSVAFALGLVLGFLAGYFGGFFDLIISRITDMFLTIPSIFFVIMTLAFFGNSLISIIIVLGFSGWMSLFKVVKSEIARIKKKDYFITAKKLKISNSNLLLKEILPVIVIPVVVNLVFQFSNVILAESSLSYLGLGAGLNYPSWGSMILSGQHYMSQGWWLILFPGVALIITLLTFNLFGENIKSHFNHGDQNL